MRFFSALITISFFTQVSLCVASESELESRVNPTAILSDAFIIEDYLPAEKIIPEEPNRRESLLQMNSRVIQDYVPNKTSTVEKHPEQETIIKVNNDNAENGVISLHKAIQPEEQYRPSIIRRVGGAVGTGLLSLGKYTIKFTSGTLSAYYLSAPANQIIANTTYSILLWTTGNPVISKLAYTFVRATPAITTMLVWKAGYQTPDILYYTAYAGWKTIEFTTTGIKYTIESIRNMLHNKEYATELIEMVAFKINASEESIDQHRKAE